MDRNQLGQKIHDLRKKNNMSQQALADKLCVSNKTISKWECGNGTPDIDTINKISDIFQVSISELINVNFSDNQSNNNSVIEGTSNIVSESENKLKDSQIEKTDKPKNKKKTLIISGVVSASLVMVLLFSLLCFLFIPRNPEIVRTNLFSIDKSNSTLYCIVDNKRSILELSKEIEVSKNCKWGIYEDLAGTKEIESKTVNLKLGDNKFYIIIENSFDEKKVYTVTIRRKFEYTITFNSMGGSVVLNQAVSEGSYIEPKIPTKKGYTFKGWYYNGELFDFNTNSIKTDMEFVAEWEIVNYKIKYEIYDLSIDNSLNVKSFTINTETFSILDVSKKGYTFGGWYDNENFNIANRITKIEKGTATDITLYAKWDIITYTITYNNQFGDIDNSANKTTYTINTDSFNIYDISRKGYTFEGWYDDDNFETANKVEKVEKESTKNIVLYAKWKIHTYNIIYTTYDPAVDNSLNQKIYTIETDTFNLFDVSKDGYTFGGWYNSEDFKTAIKISQIEKGSTETIYLFAKWDIITFEINYLTYHNDVNNSMNKTSFTINTETFDILDVSKKGYEFLGWFDSENFETANKVEKVEKGTKRHLTLYANWKPIVYTITYIIDDLSIDNSLNITSYTITSDTFELHNLNKAGYRFKGWYDGEDIDKSNKITEIEKGSTQNYTLYAKWEIITYTIKYVKYYDDVENSINRNLYNITTETFDIIDVSKKGYEFLGWFDSDDFKTANKVEKIEKGSTQNYTLYAKWEPITYTITYETDDPSIDNSLNITSYTITSDTFELHDLNRAGYRFKGWYDGKDIDKSNKITEIQKGSAKNYTLYAMWEIITYTIKYVKYYDDVENSMNKNSYNVETETFEIFSLSKNGYEFKGWYDSEDFKTANKVEKIEKGSTQNYTLYANWEVIEYQISYVLTDNNISGMLSEDVRTTYTIEDSFDLERPNSNGYMFVDWYDDKELENRGNVIKSISKGTTGDKTFYARWTDEFDHEGYRRIDSPEDFVKYKDTPVYYTDNARLYADINLYTETSTNEWKAIGTYSNSFSAIFDGNGYKIVSYNPKNTSGALGLFGYADGAIIKNLTIENSCFEMSNLNFISGGLVDNLQNSTIDNCAVSIDLDINITGNAIWFFNTIGGICANMDNSTISNSNYSGNINITDYIMSPPSIGGIVAIMGSGKIINCYSTCSMNIISNNNAISSIGGLVGRMVEGEIIDSFTTGNIKSSSMQSKIGGLVGEFIAGTITNSFATGDIYALQSSNTTYVGCLVGKNTDNVGVLTNCFGCVGQVIEGYTINLSEQKTFEELIEFTKENYDSTIWEFADNELPYLKKLPNGIVVKMCYDPDNIRESYNEYITNHHANMRLLSLIENFNTSLLEREGYKFVGWYIYKLDIPWNAERNTVSGYNSNPTLVAKYEKIQ